MFMHDDSLIDEESKGSGLGWLLLALLVLIIDQLSKNYVMTTFQLYETKALMPGINLTLAYNTGAAFSFLSDAGGWQRWLFVGIGIAVSVWLTVWLAKTPARERWTCASLALILGGAIGNIWDRVLLGYVVDFVDLYVGSWHWPAYFNIADAAICVGAAILACRVFFGDEGN